MDSFGILKISFGVIMTFRASSKITLSCGEVSLRFGKRCFVSHKFQLSSREDSSPENSIGYAKIYKIQNFINVAFRQL